MRKFKYNHPANCGYKLEVIYSYDELKKDLSDEQIEIMFVELTEEVYEEKFVDKVSKK